MPREFQKWLFEQIARKNPEEKSLVRELADVLTVSQGSIYKKMRGEVILKAEEAMRIARHFGVSIDAYLEQDKSGRAVFDYYFLQHRVRSPPEFLRNLCYELTGIIALPQPAIWYATNEIPVFHYMPYRRLLAFKLYMWSRMSWRLPELVEATFEPESFYHTYPDTEGYRQELQNFYTQIPSKEYWPLHILDHTLNQIHYCAASGLFPQADTAELLYQELLLLLEERFSMAVKGLKTKSPVAKSPEQPVRFELFFNEIAFTNNLILIFSNEQPTALYATLDNPNFIRTTDQNVCGNIKHWMEQIEQSAILVSRAGEQHRRNMFEQIKSRVDIHVQRLSVLHSFPNQSQ